MSIDSCKVDAKGVSSSRKISPEPDTTSTSSADSAGEMRAPDPRDYMDEVNRLGRQFPEHKEQILRLRQQFPELGIYELRALLLTEIQEAPFSTHRLPTTPSTQNKSNRLLKTLKKPQKVPNPFNKLNIRHQQQIKTISTQSLDTKPTTDEVEHDDNNSNVSENGANTEQSGSSNKAITSNSVPDEPYTENESQSNLQQPCIQMVNPTTGHQEWRLIDGLEEEILREHAEHETRSQNCSSTFSNDNLCTKVFHRDPAVGLGMTIRENNGYIFVHALVCQDGRRLFGTEDNFEKMIRDVSNNGHAGPAQTAGVRPGDRILGLNGKAFLRWNSEGSSADGGNLKPTSSAEIIRHAAQTMLKTPNPVVLHICPSSIDPKMLDMDTESNSSSQSTTLNNEATSESTKEKNSNAKSKDVKIVVPPLPPAKVTSPLFGISSRSRPIAAVHPFAQALTKRGLLQSGSGKYPIFFLFDMNIIFY